MLFFLLFVIGIVYYFASPEERQRGLRAGRDAIFRLRDEAIRAHNREDPFRDSLRERTSWPIVVPALVALNTIVFLRISAGDVSAANPESLVAWGASFGPRTSNGEWWRLVASSFVHTGFFQLVVNMAGLVAVGVLLERLLGHLTVALVYLSAATVAGLITLSEQPIGVSYGSTAAVLSLYGLFTSTLVWMTLEGAAQERAAQEDAAREDGAQGDAAQAGVARKVPLATLKRLAPAAGVFLLYAAVSHGPLTAYLPALFAGFAGGIALARGAGETKPPIFRTAIVAGVVAVVLAAWALPMRGIADVRPEIANVVALEDRLSSTYQKSVAQFTRGVMSAEALSQVITRSITPEIQAARARLKALSGVPPEHEAVVARADEYLRLRDESWRLRADGLHQSNMLALRKADAVERASLDAFEKVRPDGAR